MRKIDADLAFQAADHEYRRWTQAVAKADSKQKATPCFKKQQLYKAVKSVIDGVPTIVTENLPLTEEQLKRMVGQPVWIESARRKEWMLLWGYHGKEVSGPCFIFTRRTAQKESFLFSELGLTWWPFRRPPGED